MSVDRTTPEETAVSTSTRHTAHTVCAALVAAALALAACRAPAPSANGYPQTPSGTGGLNAAEHLDDAYVVLVGVDGFRHDYLDLFAAPNLARVARAGVRADGLIPPFPSLTFSSFYTIATGLYPEHHGIVGNTFFDPERNETFSLGDRESVEDGTWYGGQPIWVTAETQGMVAASFFFVGTEAAIKGVHPTYWQAYDASVPYDRRVDQVLAWLALPPRQRPHLITVYFSAVDSAGHTYGAASPEVGKAIGSVDRSLGRLLNGLAALPHGNRVYVVVVSDHGMDAVDRDELAESVDLSGARPQFLGPHLALFVRPDAARAVRLRDDLNRALDGGRAYLREEAPAALHARASPRLGDVIVVAEPGIELRLSPRRSAPLKGMHGWNPSLATMHGIFLAMGPGVAPGQRTAAFESVHVYPFLADRLGLRPSEPIDGDIAVLRPLVDP